jgi:hypothetical protein
MTKRGGWERWTRSNTHSVHDAINIHYRSRQFLWRIARPVKQKNGAALQGETTDCTDKLRGRLLEKGIITVSP